MPQQTPPVDPRLPMPGSPLTSIILLVAFVLVAALSLRGNHPPAPLGMDAPADVFSAARAKQVLVRILADERPHPTGSVANAAVRDRIVAELARLGIDADVQRRFACGGSTCATVENVVARIAGTSTEGAVLLSAHYDSVAAGPGASDDGAGVAAIIEVARALKAGPPLPRDVWLLANDGEELGLIGAEAFAREPEFKRISSVVNLEARGTTGASLLIETQPGNAAIVAAVRRALPRPGGSSLDYEIYKTLPNDTDFTVYRRKGVAGVNFAWAEGAARYHTPLDDIAHLDTGSLQQHGDNALAMARTLASTTTPLKASHDAVFFSLFGATLAGWPATWNPGLLALALIAWLTLAVRLARRGAVRVAPLIGAGAGMFAGLAVLGGIGWVMHWVMQALGALPAAWTAQGGIVVAGFLLLALPVTLLVGWLLQRWSGETAIAAASLLPFAAIAIAAVMAMSGASHMGLLPLLAGALCGHVWPGRPHVWAGVAAVVAAGLWFPYAASSYSAIGHPGLSAATLLTGLALLPLIPAMRSLDRTAIGLGGVGLLAAIACAVLAVARPAFDADSPRPMNLVYVGAEASARLFLQPNANLPTGFLHDNGFTSTSERILPWSGWGFAGAADSALLPPTLQVEQDIVVDGKRQLTIRLRSARGAIEGGLVLPGDVDVASIRVQGQALAPSRWHAREVKWRSIALVGLPAEGATFEFKASVGQPVMLYGYDRSRGVPATLAEVVRARDAVGVPSNSGDSSWSLKLLELEDQGISSQPE